MSVNYLFQFVYSMMLVNYQFQFLYSVMLVNYQFQFVYSMMSVNYQFQFVYSMMSVNCQFQLMNNKVRINRSFVLSCSNCLNQRYHPLHHHLLRCQGCSLTVHYLGLLFKTRMPPRSYLYYSNLPYILLDDKIFFSIIIQLEFFD